MLRHQVAFYYLIFVIHEIEFRSRIWDPLQIDRASIHSHRRDSFRGKHLRMKDKAPTQESGYTRDPFFMKDMIGFGEFSSYSAEFQHEGLHSQQFDAVDWTAAVKMASKEFIRAIDGTRYVTDGPCTKDNITQVHLFIRSIHRVSRYEISESLKFSDELALIPVPLLPCQRSESARGFPA